MGEYVGPARLDAFLGYVAARWKREQDEVAYRIYVTDALQLQPQNKYPKSRYWEVLNPPEQFDPQEVIARVTEKAGLVMISEST